MKNILVLLIIIPFIASVSQSTFSFEDYQNFTQSNSNLTAKELLQMNNTGEFKPSISSDWNTALFADSIEIKYLLTEDEKALIKQNGFVVSERLNRFSFVSMLADVFHKDLPVFVTTDMILHAFHRSYDAILKDIELKFLIPRLEEFLNNLVLEIPNVEVKYQTNYMKDRLKDVDLYLSVSRKLLNTQALPFYSGNVDLVNNYINLINQEEFQTIPFFSETTRKIDFSQFKPRSHYDDEYLPKLGNYFKAMIWLGRMELYLIAPEALVKPTLEEVQRQAVMANLIAELMESADLQQEYEKIENVIQAFVGEQDNVAFSNLSELKNIMEFSNSSALADTIYFKSYQDTLASQSFAPQRILSQVLIHDPASEDEIKPASAFLMFGQRFVIDSYITGSVVYDKIKEKRMLPSTLDVLFALGNDASAQLLVNELEQYKYASNLAGVRYLVDAYDNDFWNSTIYNGWLNSIRKLNPPTDRSIFPAFMQTAAWWQQKMNTQLASWTELRHDNLLYAKQSYSGGATCTYPYSYVEPFPEFYSAMRDVASNFNRKIIELNISDEWIPDYFDHLVNVNDTLYSISNKELDGVNLSTSEISFLKRMLSEEAIGCVTTYTGWYPNLFYGEFDFDFIVADYHTAPTDEFGNMVGWVAHSGTGVINLIIMNTTLPTGENVAFVGPVYSYHEYKTYDFYRLTDDEWSMDYVHLSSRPEWTKNYIADINGNKQSSSLSLLTDIDKNGNDPTIPETHIIGQNYPNPFNPSTLISFSVPLKLTNKKVKLTLFNIQGEEIKLLVNQVLSSGNYVVEWNGTDSKNSKVTSGIYFYEIEIAEERFVGKMNLIK